MRISVAIFGVLILVHCELPTSQPMGEARETSDVSHRMLVSIPLEVLHDCFEGHDHVTLRHCLQSRTVHLHWVALGFNDDLDTHDGKHESIVSHKLEFKQCPLIALEKMP